MLLYRIYLNLRCKEARRDVADPYEMHSTLCRAFSPADTKCPTSSFLWRLEPETRKDGVPIVLIQSENIPDWSRIGVSDWLAELPKKPIDIKNKLHLTVNDLSTGLRYRYRLRANPSVKRNGKRQGLYKPQEQNAWLIRHGQSQGFELETVYRSQEQMLFGKRRTGNTVNVFSVLYDGILRVSEPKLFIDTITTGIGHGKSMGLGLLSVVPVG
ncbi:MAG: type I-E CRISPR-associated protein Cas6/Cse3/CasE [Candidatus Omnitrophota bacterium]